MRGKCFRWVLFVVLFAGVTASPALASPTSLVLGQGDAFQVLGHSCGGIKEQVYATQFDPSSGFPDGDALLSTTCNGSGRGGHSTTYTAWAGAQWDLTGTIVSYQRLSAAPTVNPTLSVTDANANQLYNSGNQAYLQLAPGFVPQPRFTGISASEGPATGGTTVTISGTGLTGATAVDFGSTPAASYTVSGDQSITAVSPVAPSTTASATVDVTVTTAGGTSSPTSADQFTFVAQPAVTGLDPSSGPLAGGNWITITGTNLTYLTSVTFGDTPTGFTVIGDTSISAYVPGSDDSGGGDVNVTVRSIGGTSASSGASRYTYVAPPPLPTVTALKPSSGPASGGTTVRITGTRFTGASAVDFGGTPARRFKVVSATSITAVSPKGSAGTVDVTVTTANGTSAPTATDQFTYKRGLL